MNNNAEIAHQYNLVAARSQDEQNRVNYHEAGHAIIARVLGIKFTFITNLPNEQTSAAGRMNFGPHKLNPSNSFDVFQLLMGGIIATDVALNHYDLSEAESDFQQGWDYLAKIMETEDVTFDLEEVGAKIFEDAQDKAREILNDKLWHLHQIAAALKDKNTLTITEVDKLLAKPKPVILHHDILVNDIDKTCPTLSSIKNHYKSKNRYATQDDEILRHAAYHEIGHAVVAATLGLKFSYVSLFQPKFNNAGNGYIRMTIPVKENTDTRYVSVAYAGGITTNALIGGVFDCNEVYEAGGIEDDIGIAHKILYNLFPNSTIGAGQEIAWNYSHNDYHALQSELYKCKFKTVEIIRENEQMIHDLVETFLKKHVLYESEILTAMRSDRTHASDNLPEI